MTTQATTFDFGEGPVPAHQHPNGGGWVADTATVDVSAHVGPGAQVYGEAQVYGKAQVYGGALVSGRAQVSGGARVSRTQDYILVGPHGPDGDVYTWTRSDGCVATWNERAPLDEFAGDNPARRAVVEALRVLTREEE